MTFLQLLKRCHAVQLARHHEVQQHNVGVIVSRARNALRTAARVYYLVTFRREKGADHPPNIGLVIDDEDRCHA